MRLPPLSSALQPMSAPRMSSEVEHVSAPPADHAAASSGPASIDYAAIVSTVLAAQQAMLPLGTAS